MLDILSRLCYVEFADRTPHNRVCLGRNEQTPKVINHPRRRGLIVAQMFGVCQAKIEKKE